MPAAMGTAGLLLGFLLAVAVIAVRLGADWGYLGGVIGRNPVICWGIAVTMMLGGAALIKQASRHEPAWEPTRPGRRFQDVVLYTRENCSLCDEGVRTLEPYRRYLPPIRSIDIEQDPVLRDKHGSCIPVLEFDGRVRFRGHVSETLLRRLIEGTPPLA